jgi:hypothetical protein
METRKRARAGAATVVIAAVSLAVAGAAAGDRGKRSDDDHGHARHELLRTGVAPSLPTDPALHGVPAAGAPWVIDEGSIRLSGDGRLRIRVEGFVIPTAPQNGTNPLSTLSASLFCGADSTPAAATTTAVPFSPAGDARIDQQLVLPAVCLAPIVLLHPSGNTARYIGVSGFRR